VFLFLFGNFCFRIFFLRHFSLILKNGNITLEKAYFVMVIPAGSEGSRLKAWGI
jgi:hypothetical protein